MVYLLCKEVDIPKLLVELTAHIIIVKEVSADEVSNAKAEAEIKDDVISDIDASLNKMFRNELLNADIFEDIYNGYEPKR